MPLIGGEFLEVRDCVFIKGFPSNSGVNVSDVRKYFQEKVGECCIQMTAFSKDKRWSFITIKFDSATVAENVIERFSGKHIYGHKVQMSFWRVPRNMAHKGKFNRNTNTLCDRRWDDKRSFDKEMEKSPRHNNDFSREKNSGTTNHMSRDTVSYNDEEEFSEDPDNFREYRESNFTERYNTSENFSYKEHNEEFSNEHWSSDGERRGRYPVFEGDQPGWDSDYSGGNENFSEREYYEREEYSDWQTGGENRQNYQELSYAHEEGHWQEKEADHGRDHYFVDQDDAKDYESNFDEYDSYSELYEDHLREECDDGHYAYNKRSFEDTDEESSYTGSYRSEDPCTTNRQWHNNRDYTDTQDFLARNQEGSRSSSPLLDDTRQWPRWETVGPSNLTRRKQSDPDIITNTPKDTTWAQELRTCDKFRDLTGRRATALLEERPRSDEWLRNTDRRFKDRGRHSASPVNLRPKVYGHRGSPLMDKNVKVSSEISYKTVHSNRGRNSISPARDRHSSANRGSRRSLSAERSSGFKVHRTSPGSERSSQSFDEHGLERRKRESRSYSPNPNAKVPLLRGRSHEGGTGGRRGSDLRRSLMLHQQRKHSSLRARGREEIIKHSERGSKTSPDMPDKSPASYSSVESSTSIQGTNRKRHNYDGEERRAEIETTKRRRKINQNNSDNASTYSDPENGNGDSTRNKRVKTTSESRKQPSPNQKRKSRQKEEDKKGDNSNTKRADRLLSDLAATLAEGNISLRRPKDSASNSVNSVPHKCVDSVKVRVTKPTGQSEGSRPSEKSCQEQEKAAATVTGNLQSVDTVKDVSCASEADESWSTEEGTPEGEVTTPEHNTGQLAVQCCDGSSDQDVENGSEFDTSNDFSEENSDYAEKSAQTDRASPESQDVLDIKKNCTFIVDDFEKTDKVHETRVTHSTHSKGSARTSEGEFIAKVVKETDYMHENGHSDQHTTTDESSEELDSDSHDFTLHHSHVTDNTNCTAENDTRNEMMSTNLQHVQMEISPVEENLPKLDVGQGAFLPGDFAVCEEGRNEHGARSSYIIENCREVERGSSSNNEFPLIKSRSEEVPKTSSENQIQLAEDNGEEIVCQKRLQGNIQQTSRNSNKVDVKFSSQPDDTSPGVILSNRLFCSPVELDNTGNTMVDRGNEEDIMKNASPYVTNTEHKIAELGNVRLSAKYSRPEFLLPQINASSIEASADVLKQGRYNSENPNCDNSGKLAVCPSEKAQVDTHTEKEHYVSQEENSAHRQGINNHDKEAYSTERCHLNPRYIDGKSDATTEVTDAVLEVPELENTVNYFKSEKNIMCTEEEVYILEGAKVTQREVYDESDIDHVYNSNGEESNADDGEFDANNTEQVCVASVLSDTQQKMHNQVGNNSNRKDGSMEDAVVGVNEPEQEHCDVERIDVVHSEEGNRNVCGLKDKENNSESVGFDAFCTQQEVCDMETIDLISSGNKATEERHCLKNFDFISEERKYNNKEHEVYNVKDICVTQQEVYCSKNGNSFNSARKESNTAEVGGVYTRDTEQKSHRLDKNSCYMGDQVIQEKRSTTNVLSNVTNKTVDARCNFSNQGEELNGETTKANPAHIEMRYSSRTGSEPCHSSVALVQYSPSTSSLDNSHDNPHVKESHNLVAKDFDHVDREISSDEERKDHFIGPAIIVDTDTIDNDGCRPYSPSSPTWGSDELRSPIPKDDTSLYSPSHPTNVSEGDVELSITIEDVSYESDKRECDTPTCDTMEVVYPNVRKNNLRDGNADEEAEVLHFNQTINSNSIGGTTTSSFRLSSSPKSGVGLNQADDFINVNMPNKDLTQNRDVTSGGNNGESGVKDSEVCSDNSATEESGKDGHKHLSRCQKRTQSLPVYVSMDTKPKVVYVTATKTHDVYTESVAQHKPRIFYATNDKTAGPVRSLSLDTALGKSWPLGENSLLGFKNTTKHCEQQPPFETISAAEFNKRKEEKGPDGHFEPLFPDGSFISDAPLETKKVMAQDGDQGALKISTSSSSARLDGINMLLAIEGLDNCTDCGVTGCTSSVDKESVVPSSNTDGDTIPMGSALESKRSLVIQAPPESRQKDWPTEQSFSSDRVPSQITGKERSCVSNISCEPGDISVTSELAEKRVLASASGSCSFGLCVQGTLLPKSSAQEGNTVSKEKSGNEKDVPSENLSEIQKHVLPRGTVQVLPDSAPRPTNKRTHNDSAREASRPCKVPRKPLKLIIPTTPLSNRGMKRASKPAYLARYSKKTSTSTATRTSTDLCSEKRPVNSMHGDGLAISGLFSGDKDTMITAKDSNNENVGLVCTLSPATSRMNGNESYTPFITDCLPPTCETENTSPLTPRLSPCNQTPTAEKSNIKEHTAGGVVMDGRASCSGKESESVALKMKRLRKKKEEIEQVYKRECHTVVNVVKMLVSNDPRLEGLLQNAVRRSLQEMGRRCVQELEKQARPGT